MDSKSSDEKFDIELGDLSEFGELFQKNNLLERDPDNHDRHDRHDKINKNYINTCCICVIRKMIECYKNNNYFGFSGLFKILFCLFFVWFLFLR